jgi:hypothetical protein
MHRISQDNAYFILFFLQHHLFFFCTLNEGVMLYNGLYDFQMMIHFLLNCRFFGNDEGYLSS